MNIFASVIDAISRALPSESLAWTWINHRAPLTALELEQLENFWARRDAGHRLRELDADESAMAALAKNLGWPVETLGDFIDASYMYVFADFSLVSMLTQKTDIEAIRELPFVSFAHAVSDDMGLGYLRMIKGMQRSLAGQADVVNMSLEPLKPYKYDEREALNVASKALFECQIVCVVAAGNFGPADDTMNPWAVAPWVIGVGAADSEGKKLWEGSSRGVPGDPVNHPTVVAPGINIKAAKPLDPTRPDRGSVTGSSPATAHVSGLAARLYELVNSMISSDHAAEPSTSPDRLNRAAIVRRLLIDMARPMPGYDVHEVGAGFVSASVADSYFESLDPFHLLQTVLAPDT